MSNPEDYTVGWICANTTEFVAAKVFLDERHDAPQYVPSYDINDYTLGKIGQHNVVIAVFPYSVYEIASTASVARAMMHSFPNIRICLIVGIGGGAPSIKHDIRLGDVVVGTPQDRNGGVIQYRLRKTIQGQNFQQIGFLKQPPTILITAIARLKVQYQRFGHQFEDTINSLLEKNPKLWKKYKRPDSSSDRLYKSEFVHPEDGRSCATVCGNDPSNIVSRIKRAEYEDKPAIHYGIIALAKQLMNDATIRDKAATEKDVLCFEIEAAGLFDHCPYLLIYGICNYSDSHKNQKWQGYAAMTAAAYAKDLLYQIPLRKIEAAEKISFLPGLYKFTQQDQDIAKEQLKSLKDLDKQRQLEEEQKCRQLFRLISNKYATYEWRKDQVVEGAKDTFLWFLKHENFQIWLKQKSGSLLVTAGPGHGKSVLAKYLIDHELPRSETICYFFFNCQDQDASRQALCALLHQLFSYKPPLIKHAMPLFHEDGQDLINSIESLWRILRGALNDPEAGPIIVVLDALNECDESEAADVMRNIKGRFYSDQLSNGKLKFLLTCRPNEQLISQFHSPLGSVLNIRIQGEEELKAIRQDVNHFVTYRLSYPPQNKDHSDTNNNGDATYVWNQDQGGKRVEDTESVNYDYLPSIVMTVTKSVGLSQADWSSSYAQETTNVSTIQSSIDPGMKEIEQDTADNESVYTSDILQLLKYNQELATSFFENSELPDNKCLERIHEILPELLRGFALRIGGEDQSSAHLEVMKYVQKNRVRIAAHFEEYYLTEKDDNRLQKRALNDMPLDERLGRWQVDAIMDDPNSAASQPFPDAPLQDNEDQSFIDDDGDESSVDDSQLSTYRNIVASSIAFRWLFYRVRRETYLTVSEAKTMHAIATKIRQALYTRKDNRLISSKRGPPSCSMLFGSDWDPLAFVTEQGYTEKPDEALGRAIVIVQSTNGDSEAMTCSEYLGLTWPIFGDDIMGLVKHVIRSKPGLRCSVILFDKTKLTAWIETSGYFTLEVVGVLETIVEVGEVYGWMTTAVRSAPGDAIYSVTPIIDISAQTNDSTFRADFHLQYSNGPWPSTGQCWQELFRNPLVVLGFPVRRREPGQEPGLECSFATLVALVGARRITVFCGRVFLKSFCTMLVPTKYATNTVYWHVLFHEDGSWIPFTDPRVRDVVGNFNLLEHLTLTGIETARHVVGWYKNIRNYAGSREANYAVGITDLRQPDSRFAFDRVSVSLGKTFNVGVSGVIGKKDKPGRAIITDDYNKQIEWVEQRFIVFYDRNEKRAWLIDGLSALLHLVRASLARRRNLGHEVLFDENDIKESDSPYTGKAAARAVFYNRDNQDLKIYERWNRVVEETSQEGAVLETKQTTRRTWEQLPDLVGEIYMTLRMLFDVQTDVMTTNGYGARVRTSPRRHLEGWEFRDVATGADPLLPKATILQEFGLGWVDLVRNINAIILFGVDFGEILKPLETDEQRALSCKNDIATVDLATDPAQGGNLCARWTRLPSAHDLLATTTPVIRDIMERVYKHPDKNKPLWELAEGLYWHSPDRVFENCHCGADPTKHCDRVQVLLPTQFPRLFTRGLRSPSEPLPAHGAVIFGHSVKFPLTWKREAGTIPTEDHLLTTRLPSVSSRQSDISAGASTTTLSNGGSTSRTPSTQSIKSIFSKAKRGLKDLFIDEARR